ncbi:translation initiation factor IF-3 [Helicobacter sp. MIT 14-3879]|nr:translation initiation factor IF-3 [Helicobacter sp. MIT 14-3879]RDU62466.1 translation initiation factor IF-3 [Helicobacter sp. MIT 14-3879]
MKDNTLLNNAITFDEVRCIGKNGEQLGILSSDEALSVADEAGLDLVLISPNAKPPVCKIMDYGKFCYQKEKKNKEAKKKQKQIEIKEIKLSPQIAQNDINYKVKHAKEFLSNGKHVKFRVFLKGREMADPKQGFNVLNKIIDMLTDCASTEGEPTLDGRYVNILVTPKKA